MDLIKVRAWAILSEKDSGETWGEIKISDNKPKGTIITLKLIGENPYEICQ